MVSPYCSKGSLQDVLENSNIRLDLIFKLSFASDIAQVRSQFFGRFHTKSNRWIQLWAAFFMFVGKNISVYSIRSLHTRLTETSKDSSQEKGTWFLRFASGVKRPCFQGLNSSENMENRTDKNLR